MAKTKNPILNNPIIPPVIANAINQTAQLPPPKPVTSNINLLKPATPFTDLVNNANANKMQSVAQPTNNGGGSSNSFDGIIRGEFGQIAGMIIGGKPYLGMTPADIEKLAAGRLGATKGGPATQALEAVTAQQQAEAQQAQIAQNNQSLANDVLNPVTTPMGQATDLSQVQAAYAGTAKAIPSIVTNALGFAGGGALGGAAIGAAGGPIGAAGGAILGAIAGVIKAVWTGVQNNLEQQAGESISSQNKVLIDGKANLKKLIALTKSNPQMADQYLTAYQQQKSQMTQAYSNLKLDTGRDAYKFLSKDGILALQGFENFYADGGLNQIYDSNMQLAILGKNPDITDLMMYTDEVSSNG